MKIRMTLLAALAAVLVADVAYAACQDGTTVACTRNGCRGVSVCVGGRFTGCGIPDACMVPPAPPPKDRVVFQQTTPWQEVGILYDGADAQGPFNDRSAVVTASGGTLVLPNLLAPAAGNSLVAFASEREPVRVSAPWTPGSDTITVLPSPDIGFDITFWILSGTFPVQRMQAGAAVLAVNNAYRLERAGLRIASVTINDSTMAPGAAAVRNGGTMQQFQAIGFNPGQINVYVIATVAGGPGNGLNFDGTPVIVFGQDALLFPALLEHELGHAFVLWHVGAPDFNWENVMTPVVSAHFLSEGQTFRMHFHPSSQINVFNLRPGRATLSCGDVTTGDCPANNRRIWSDGSLPPN